MLALAGAFVIVELAPAERPVLAGDKVVLMESATPLRPFDAPARSRPPAPPPPMPVQQPVAVPPGPDLLSMLREESPSVPAPSAALPAAPPRPVRREAPHTLVAAAPPPALPTQALATQALPAQSLPAQAPPEARPVLPPPAPLIRPKPEPAQPAGVLTPAEVRRFRLTLRLTREQEPYWPPVEQALVEIGAQQAAMVRAGQDPKDALGVGAAMRMYSVARPLLDSLREDQKARVRAQARSMGFASVASQI